MSKPMPSVTIPGADSAQVPPATLAEWLDRLAARNRLRIIRPNLALKFGVAAVAAKLDGESATLFPSPGGHAIPVVSGIVSRREWIADAMGVAPDEVVRRFEMAANAPLPCERVAKAAVHEVVHRAPIDIPTLLPVPVHNELDAGPYLSAGLLISANPKTRKQNVSINRCQVKGGSRLGVSVSSRDTGNFVATAEAAGEGLPVAIVIGVDPLTLLASQALVAPDEDELAVSGALHGRPLRVVKCLGSELLVPADAEIVLEGRFIPNVREPEGPFGEFTQYYGLRGDRFVIEIEVITHRARPIFHTIVGGSTEHILLGAVAREASFLATMQRVFPNVLNLHLAPGGVGRYHLYVQIRKTHDGSAKNIMLNALSLHHDVKLVVVVDEDIDIYNPTEVEWAVATRFQADQDLVTASNTRASRGDPSTRNGIGARMGLDATKPLDAPPGRYTRIRVPGKEEVDLDAVTAKIAPGDWRKAVGG